MPDTAKGTAMSTRYPNVHLLAQTDRLRALHAVMRDADTGRGAFTQAANRVIRQLLEASLDLLPYRDRDVITPVGARFEGRELATALTAVSVVRAGESMEGELRAAIGDVPIGKILIQRDRQTKQPSLFYSSLPPGIAEGHVLLMEPMLATGGSAIRAVEVLLAAGVRIEAIVFVNILAAPTGIERLLAAHPALTIVTSSIESHLNQDAYMIPGIGDFGDRYFGTVRMAS